MLTCHVQRRNLTAGMLTSRLFTMTACILVLASGVAARIQERRPAALPDPTARFDPARDAEGDINAAVAEAKRTGKRVILDVGGEWCGCYPHLFVLDRDGTLLQSQDTSPLESGPSYDLARMTAFLNKWAAAF